jgi:hypothetical protein
MAPPGEELKKLQMLKILIIGRVNCVIHATGIAMESVPRD